MYQNGTLEATPAAEHVAAGAATTDPPPAAAPVGVGEDEKQEAKKEGGDTDKAHTIPPPKSEFLSIPLLFIPLIPPTHMSPSVHIPFSLCHPSLPFTVSLSLPPLSPVCALVHGIPCISCCNHACLFSSFNCSLPLSTTLPLILTPLTLVPSTPHSSSPAAAADAPPPSATRQSPLRWSLPGTAPPPSFSLASSALPSSAPPSSSLPASSTPSSTPHEDVATPANAPTAAPTSAPAAASATVPTAAAEAAATGSTTQSSDHVVLAVSSAQPAISPRAGRTADAADADANAAAGVAAAAGGGAGSSDGLGADVDPEAQDSLRQPLLQAHTTSEAQQAEQQAQQQQQDEQEEQNELQRWAAAVGWGEMMGAYSVLHTDDNTDLHLFSLHVTRGLAILGLLLCAYLGPSFPAFAPSPWHGLSLADLPLPLLLYTVGLSLALAYTQVPSVLAASNKVYIRFCKIFYLGYFLQGGFLHPIGDTSFGVSLENTRFCGMLQQVAAALLVVGVSEVAVMKLYRGVRRPPGVHHHALGFLINWCVALLLVLLYASLSYLLFVPSYTLSITTSIHSNTTTVIPTINTTALVTINPTSHLEALHEDGLWEGAGGQRRALQGGRADDAGSLAVHCGMSGSFSPACNAAGYIDRVLMGPTHMLSTAPFHSLPECQRTSPLPPAWCQAPFDSQGILSTVGACLVAFAGLHHGHLLTYFNTHSWRIFRSLLFATVLLATGVTLSMPVPLHSSLPSFLPDSILSGMPFNPQLFTISFAAVAAAVSCFLFSCFFILTDVYTSARPFLAPIAWLGRNPLFVLVLGVCRLLDLLLAGFYVNNDPASNLLSLPYAFLVGALGDETLATAAAAVLGCIFWCLTAGLTVRYKLIWTF
ncbi:unnamed protein product [Closterium sp. NIES-54]